MDIIKKRGFKPLVFIFALIFLFYIGTDGVCAAPIYTFGASGEPVKQIQRKLKQDGFYNGEINGRFNFETFEAVRSYQKKQRLVSDGIVGEKTLAAMGIVLDTSAGTLMRSLPKSTLSPKENDVWLLACLISGEGRGENYIGKVAIGAVVMNRVKHPSFPSTLSGVIYQNGAFDAVTDGQINLIPSASCINAARDALNGWDPVGGSIFYWNPEKSSNKFMQNLTITKTIENHAFARN